MSKATKNLAATCPTCDAKPNQLCRDFPGGRPLGISHSSRVADPNPVTLKCPKCNARPGERCRTQEGKLGLVCAARKPKVSDRATARTAARDAQTPWEAEKQAKARKEKRDVAADKTVNPTWARCRECGAKPRAMCTDTHGIIMLTSHPRRRATRADRDRLLAEEKKAAKAVAAAEKKARKGR